MLSASFKISDPVGVHARPATKLVQTAKNFESEVHIEAKGKTGSLASILGIMSLGIQQGDEITITASGKDEKEAIEALETTLKESGLV